MERMSKKEIRKFTNIVNNVILEKNFLGYQLESEIFGNRADKPYQCVFYKRICGGVEFRLVIRIEEFPGFDMRNIHVECQAARVADMFTFVSYSTNVPFVEVEHLDVADFISAIIKVDSEIKNSWEFHIELIEK